VAQGYSPAIQPHAARLKPCATRFPRRFFPGRLGFS
jgi:hypothetical protein